MVNKKRILIIDADYTVWTSATSLFVGGNCCSQPWSHYSWRLVDAVVVIYAAF